MSAARSPGFARTRRMPFIWLIRVGVSALMLTLIFTFVPFASVWAAARQFSPGLWLAALCLFIAGHAAAAAKWRLLIGGGISYRQAFRAHLAGLAANLALPGVAGGDVVRAGLVMGKAHDKGRLAVGSLADRVLDTLGLVLIALAGAYAAWRPEMDAGPGWAWILLAALALVACAFPAVPALDRMLKRREVTGKVSRMIGKMVSATADLMQQPARLFLCLGISMLIQCLFVGINIAFARAAHVDAPIAAWFFAWTTAKIIAIAPISLGGLGVREASMAGLLRPFGADPGQVVAIGLIWQSVLYASGAIGFIVQLQRPSPGTPTTERAQ